jgi:hypothetical protein
VFLSLMSAYAIFMAPMASILFTDYWLVKHRKYDVPALYDPRGIYRYDRYGTNWRAVVATFVTIIPLLPGLANKVNPDLKLSAGLRNLFTFNWLYGFFLSIFLYYFCNLFFPALSIWMGLRLILRWEAYPWTGLPAGLRSNLGQMCLIDLLVTFKITRRIYNVHSLEYTKAQSPPTYRPPIPRSKHPHQASPHPTTEHLLCS